MSNFRSWDEWPPTSGIGHRERSVQQPLLGNVFFEVSERSSGIISACVGFLIRYCFEGMWTIFLSMKVYPHFQDIGASNLVFFPGLIIFLLVPCLLSTFFGHSFTSPKKFSTPGHYAASFDTVLICSWRFC